MMRSPFRLRGDKTMAGLGCFISQAELCWEPWAMAHHLACAIQCMGNMLRIACESYTTTRTINDPTLARECQRHNGWPLKVVVDGMEPFRFVVTLGRIYDLGTGRPVVAGGLNMAEALLATVMREIAGLSPERLEKLQREMSGSCP